MKKYFYLAAVSAMMLTACSSDKDVLEPTPKPSTPTVVAQQQAVAFDTYLAGTTASTRAGDPEGVMTTDKLKTANKGFGVFAYYADGGSPYATGLTPNFMYNEQIHWKDGWTYSPLKYWPNETKKDASGATDSQSTPATATELDKLSFFAYAPYVNLTTAGKLLTSDASNNAYVESGASAYGITGISDEQQPTHPKVRWTYSTDIDKGVDLLWGVAPKGMDYTAVNGNNVSTTFGLPLVNLVKPDKDMKVKFLFQHALSRVGLTVVSAIDQIAAGDDGGKFDNNQTRVLIEKVEVWGDFGEEGILNLNNTNANEALWESVTKNTTSSSASPLLSFDNGTSNYLIAKDLRYNATAVGGIKIATNPKQAFLALNEGVLPSEKVLIAGGPDENNLVTLAGTETYAFGTAYYQKATSPATSKEMIAATVNSTETVATYIQDAAGNFIQVKTATGNQALDGVTKYYSVAENEKDATSTAIAVGDYYWEKSGTDGNILYFKKQNNTGRPISTGKYYLPVGTELTSTATYTPGDYYKGLTPRYFMVIPSDLTPTPTNIGVTITYHVITYDEKLQDKVSDVKNVISKTTTLQLESGKSYNLKLILGLTSVKLDAVVGEWQVGDAAEVWVPQNN